jgi:hypothetical protein
MGTGSRGEMPRSSLCCVDSQVPRFNGRKRQILAAYFDNEVTTVTRMP